MAVDYELKIHCEIRLRSTPHRDSRAKNQDGPPGAWWPCILEEVEGDNP